jgi:ubiquinone/menaquinone biosynthesis C-methylase UbiE
LDWDEVYKGTPAWDVGHPQHVFEVIVEDGEIKPGRVLDIGCGRGDNAIMLALNGCNVTGIDISEIAISDAKAKSAERHVNVNFIVGDILKIDQLFKESEFDVVIDSFLFHTMTDEERPIFAKQVYKILKPEGKYFMLCFSDKDLAGPGPRRISKAEIESTFTSLFKIVYIVDTSLEANTGRRSAYLLSAVRC